VCGDSVDLIENKPTGSVRISFGFSSTLNDAQYFLQFVYECFLDKAGHTVPSLADGVSSVTDSMSMSVADSMSSVASSLSVSVADTVTPLTLSVFENVAASISVSCDHCRLPVNMMKTVAAAADNDDNDNDGDDANGLVCGDAASMLLPVKANAPLPVKASVLSLVKLFVYPVKSCAAVQVNKPLNSPVVVSGHLSF